MKKIFIIIIILMTITGCNQQKIKEKINNQKNNISQEEPKEIENKYVDNNPIKIGLYLKNNANERILTDEYNPTWILHKDLCSLEIYYTNEEKLDSNSQKELWKKFYNEYQNIEKYKLGIKIEFDTSDGHVNDIILTPKDTTKFFSLYILMYLYDDINNDGFYSHLTEENSSDNTIISSIKLTSGTYYEKIESDITLTVFTYDKDDINENNEYIGNSKYTIIIKKEK